MWYSVFLCNAGEACQVTFTSVNAAIEYMVDNLPTLAYDVRNSQGCVVFRKRPGVEHVLTHEAA